MDLDFIHERWFRLVLLGVAGSALLLMLLLVLSGRPKEPVIPPGAALPMKELKFSDFLIEDPVPLDRPDWQLLRPPRQKWEPEEVARFWIDPVEMGIQALGEENDKMVEEFLGAIP